MKPKLRDQGAIVIAIALGAGLVPLAPGTAGSALALPLAWFCSQWLGTPGLVGCTIAVTLLGFWACYRVEQIWEEHDAPRIVIDEVAGQLITLLPLASSWLHLLVGFGFFRLFDMLKPWPAGWIDRNVKGGAGVMLDDLMAGAYAWVVTFLLLKIKVIDSILAFMTN